MYKPTDLRTLVDDLLFLNTVQTKGIDATTQFLGIQVADHMRY